MTTTPYILRFKEILRNYAFGGRWMPEVFQEPGLPEDHTLAETWEAVDRPGESSPILNGPLQGQALHDAIALWGEGLLGRQVVEQTGTRFPLLIKFLDASHVLGEQIHPTDEQARAFSATDTGKTEAWYMVHTRPDNSIHAGPRPGLTREQLAEALLRKDSVSTMQEYVAKPGDAFLLYAGTMHYSCGGTLFCEIMQNSDVTISLNRYIEQAAPAERRQKARELAEMIHVEEEFDPRTRPIALPEGPNTHTYIMACRYFAMERWDLTAPQALRGDGRRFSVISQIGGRLTVRSGEQREELLVGQSCLLPAGLAEVVLEPAPQATALVMYVPDLQVDIMEPLRARGIGDEAIIALGGHTELNDLAKVV